MTHVIWLFIPEWKRVTLITNTSFHIECNIIKTATAFNAMEATLQQQVKLCKYFVKNVNLYQNNG